MNLHEGVSALPESSGTRKPEVDDYICFYTEEKMIEYLKEHGTKLDETNGRDNGRSED